MVSGSEAIVPDELPSVRLMIVSKNSPRLADELDASSLLDLTSAFLMSSSENSFDEFREAARCLDELLRELSR